MENKTTKTSKYKSSVLILAIGCVLIFASIFSINYFKNKAKLEKIMERRSSKLCQDLYKDTYEGVIVKAKKNHIRIRRLNGKKYQEFNYFFKLSYNVTDDFYAGQNLSKQADSEFFSADMHDGGKKEFNIPCWD